MMRRRDLFVAGAGVCSLLTSGSNLLAEETTAWGSAVGGLRLGLRLDSLSQGNLFVFLENRGPAPLELFVSFVDVQRFELTATAPGGKEYSVADALMYRPCAGLCGLPFTEYLNPGASRKSTYALEKLRLVPSKGQYVPLRPLLQQGYFVRAFFEVTEQQLKEVKLSLENPWLGRIVSGEIRLAQLNG